MIDVAYYPASPYQVSRVIMVLILMFIPHKNNEQVQCVLGSTYQVLTNVHRTIQNTIQACIPSTHKYKTKFGGQSHNCYDDDGTWRVHPKKSDQSLQTKSVVGMSMGVSRRRWGVGKYGEEYGGGSMCVMQVLCNVCMM